MEEDNNNAENLVNGGADDARVDGGGRVENNAAARRAADAADADVPVAAPPVGQAAVRVLSILGPPEVDQGSNVVHKYLDECGRLAAPGDPNNNNNNNNNRPLRPLRTYRDIVTYEKGVIDSFRNDHGLTVGDVRDPEYRRTILEISRLADGGDEWDLPREIAVFDDVFVLTVGAGCRSLPDTIKYMKKLRQIELINCSLDFVVPQSSLENLTIDSLKFERCHVRTIAQFAGLPASANEASNNDDGGRGRGTSLSICLTNCVGDGDYIVPMEQCIRRKKISLWLYDCPGTIIKAFFHFKDVQLVNLSADVNLRVTRKNKHMLTV
mmetsp:Transcript_11114/g.26388  ORF Transcript_11114/g.26388 Transcript_11114/m.26388 type:complete len:324 (-) Transcript_11114:1062-2033(-)